MTGGHLLSQIGWIDFSPEHRDKVASVLDALEKDGSVDELGIGIIRNSLSDLLFPGISTIQTRAKYFFLVPYMIKDYSRLPEKERNKKKLSEYLRTAENELIWRCAEDYGHSEELGIVGITMKRGQELARKPSSIYWNGLRTHHLIETGLSLKDYLDAVDSSRSSTLHSILQGDDSPIDDQDASYEDRFRIKVPYHNDWADGSKVDIELTREEAVYLKNRFIDYHTDKLLGQLWTSKRIVDGLLKVRDFKTFCQLPAVIDLPPATRAILKMAYEFNYIIHGAHIRYNCLLQNIFGTPGNFRKEWSEWLRDLTTIVDNINDFQTEELLSLSATTLPAFTKQFVREWIGAVQVKHPDIKYLDKLVKSQEIMNKGRKARLRQNADEKINDWTGIEELNYRFPQVQTIIRDIMKGLS